MGGGDAAGFTQKREKLMHAWAAAGRTDEPRTMALFYDEVICFPASADPEQVDLLAEAIK
jgi:hypothetical protein